MSYGVFPLFDILVDILRFDTKGRRSSKKKQNQQEFSHSSVSFKDDEDISNGDHTHYHHQHFGCNRIACDDEKERRYISKDGTSMMIEGSETA